MIALLKSINILLPELIIGITIIGIILSIVHHRKNKTHCILTVSGLSIAALSLQKVWNQESQNFFPLMYVDNFSVLYIFLILISSISSSILSYQWLSLYPNNNRDEFYLLLLISSMGSVVLPSVNNLIILFVGIELSSLPLFGLIGYAYFNRLSLSSSIKYIVLSGVSSSFLLLGIALIYSEIGCLSFIDMHNQMLQKNFLINQPVFIIGLGMMMVGFGFKLSFFPFHFWIPDIYQGAPCSVAMYLNTGFKIAVFSALIRFFMIFPNKEYNIIFYMLFFIIASCSIIFGNLMAIKQSSMRRVLAYSSIAHMGYICIGLIELKTNPIALEAIGIYLISYLFASIGVFSIVGMLSNVHYDKNLDDIYSYQGLFWEYPILSIMFSIMMLSLSGIPITLGFVGKFYLFILGINSKLWWSVIFMIIGSIIGIFYYLKIMIKFYFRPVNSSFFLHRANKERWFYTPEGIIIITSVFIILLLGIYPQSIIYYLYKIFSG